jgi:hypothetical protein
MVGLSLVEPVHGRVPPSGVLRNRDATAEPSRCGGV